jgi:hypothetical protein
MCLMNGIFINYLDKFVIVFLDDILIYSMTKEEHEHQLILVLQVLREYNLYAKLTSVIFTKNGSIIWGTLFQKNT